MGRISSIYRGLIASILCGLTLNAMAQTPTQAQLDQFRRLPPQQQKALARQFGVDVTQLRSSGGLERPSQPTNIPSIQPRKSEDFSEQGSLRRLNSDYAENQEKKLKPFGYDLFEGEPTSYVPLNDVPVPSDYIVAAGDEIIVQLYGKSDVDDVHRLVVRRDGTIAFPQLGNINVSGTPFSQLQQSLAQRVQSQILGVKVAVSMGQLRTIQIVVTGDAYKPGSYLLNGLSTVSQAIIAAGGFRETGSLRNIQVKRNGNLVKKIDLYDLLLRGVGSFDVRLQSGDVVWVGPVGQRVAVSGEVTRPGIYEIGPQETLDTVLAMAGGTRSEALLDEILVERRSAKGLSVNAKSVLSSKGRNFGIEGGDEIIVQTKSSHYTEAVNVRGAVLRQGFFPVSKGMRISDIFTSFDRDIGAAADLDYALLIRAGQYGSNLTIHQFSLAAILKDRNAGDNFELKARDELWFFSNGQGIDIWGRTREQSKKVFGQELKSFERFQLGMPSDYSNALFPGRSSQDVSLERAYLRNDQRSPQALERGRGGDERYVGANDRRQRLRNSNDPDTDSPSSRERQQHTDRRHLTLADNDGAFDARSSSDRRSPKNSLSKGKERSRELFDPYQREVMLAPLLEKLRRQASPSNPLRLVEVRGAVKFPGIYPLAEGGKFESLISAAGGFEEKSYPGEAELSRYSMVNGEMKLRHRRIQLPQLSGRHFVNDSFNITLQPRDTINIFTRPEWRDEINVELLGEVSFPGVYSMQRGETLAELIKRAGGLTSFAFSKGAVFSRESLRLQEQKRMDFLSQQLRREVGNLMFRQQTISNSSAFSPKEALEVLDQLGDEQAVGRMVINLDKAINDDSEYNILLEDGDKLVVPSYRPEVQVVGQVQFASNHLFNKSLSVNDYVRLAGGYKRQADKKQVYVIRANGSVMIPKRHNWFKRNGEKLGPGDTVVVPVNTSYMDGYSILSTASQLVNQVALSAAAFANLRD